MAKCFMVKVDLADPIETEDMTRPKFVDLSPSFLCYNESCVANNILKCI